MTRFIIPALVALLVSGPVWAAKEDGVILHCSGWSKDEQNRVSSITENHFIALDGSWIEFNSQRIKRTEIQESGKVVNWIYEYSSEGFSLFIRFDARRMKIFANDKFLRSSGITWSKVIKLDCFPIENPLKF